MNLFLLCKNIIVQTRRDFRTVDPQRANRSGIRDCSRCDRTPEPRVGSSSAEVPKKKKEEMKEKQDTTVTSFGVRATRKKNMEVLVCFWNPVEGLRVRATGLPLGSIVIPLCRIRFRKARAHSFVEYEKMSARPTVAGCRGQMGTRRTYERRTARSGARAG